MTTVRLDVETETVLERSALQRLRPFVGVSDSGGQQLSEHASRKLRELLEGKRR